MTLRPLAPLQILGYAGDWSYVYNPRGKVLLPPPRRGVEAVSPIVPRLAA